MRARTVTAAAVAVAVAGGGLAASQFAAARPAAVTLKISADKSALKFNKKSLRAPHGKVTIRMANPSSLPHAVAIEGKGIDKHGKTVRKGGTSVVSATLKKGRYTFYCPVRGHEAAGMKGRLTVT